MLLTVTLGTAMMLGTSDDLDWFRGEVERALENRPYSTEYVETIWDGAIIAEDMRWGDGSWWTRNECEVTYLGMSGSHTQREFARPQSLPDITRTVWRPGEIRSALSSPAEREVYVTLFPQFIHPGFNEFAMWFNLVHDRYEGGIFPPLLPSICPEQVVEYEVTDNTVRCRFFRLRRESRQTELVAQRDPFRITQVTHYYAHPEWTGSFEERTAARLQLSYGEYRDFGDGLVLPESARLDSVVRESQTDTWDSPTLQSARDSVEYRRTSATLVAESNEHELVPPLAIPANARIKDAVNRLDYTFGSTQVLIDGTLYATAAPIDTIISSEVLSRIMKQSLLLTSGQERDPASTVPTTGQSGSRGTLRIVLVGLLAGLGLGLCVYYAMRWFTR